MDRGKCDRSAEFRDTEGYLILLFLILITE